MMGGQFSVEIVRSFQLIATEHKLLYLALEKHVKESWITMYLQRWLEAPVQLKDGT